MVRKVLYVSLVLCLAVLLYAGCKGKTKPVNVPVSLFRVTFSDNDTDGFASIGDELIVAFDRHIQLNSIDVNAVFELSNAPTDTFGASPTMLQTSGHAITITLGTGPDLGTDGSGFITSSIRVSETVPFGAIRDAAWMTSMTGGGLYKNIEGRMGYYAPRLYSAIYDDVDVSGTPTLGDTITLTFTGDVIPNFIGQWWPGWTFILPVNWDHFGSGASAVQGVTPDEIVIIVGSGAKFTVNGVHAIGSYLIDSPSGIDMAINLTAGLVSYDAGGTLITVPPMALDIQ